jgi:RNA polymerase sigma factor (sigma-70 family)
MEPMRTLEELEKPLRQLREQFETLTLPHRPDLWRYCLRLTGSPWDAEDLVQETLARAFARMGHYWQPLEARPYLFRIATNAWIDARRRARLEVDELDDNVAAPTDADPAATLAAMEALVALLPARQRVVLLLTQVFHFTAAEVAAMTGSTEGAVKAALHRARTTLAGAAAREGAPSRPAPAAPAPVVAAYLDAFNRRDMEAICALLTEDAMAEMVGVAEEVGREVVRRNSLTEWAADPQPMWAEPGTLDGRDVLYVFFRTEAHEKALAWILTFEAAGARIATVRNYCFCPDLLQHAADQLGVPASLYGYRYTAPAVS